ncbi:flagellar biosynthesis protein [Cohnella sp. LGH]|uniref:Flagellar operon protein n=1 Tax=Cohnella phaseoli TaxID=456490 RepID=A0A3D9KLF8_9BACL|nr:MULTISPECIES: TIGR02530 family flagellar biosynthesis protein [Cohnella]QTH45901.1 flagellar biosynthesis protein [Cohnella sp. LGH]RED86403.1 flagellar operon protein [Cohnella phaseoli]
MNNPMLVGHLTTGRTGPIQGHRPSDRNRQTNSDGVSFQELLSQQQLKFSHHAEQRLQQRGIQLQPDQLERIASAVDQAAAKGAKDSLVLFQDIAMIVSVPNRTVVTAMDGHSMKEHIFTQIDSAVVVS